MYRIDRCRFLPCWAIVGVLCIVVCAGCADNTDSAVQRTNLAIDNLRLDSIADDLATIAFTINEPATIFWALYARDSVKPNDATDLMNNIGTVAGESIVKHGGIRGESISIAGEHTFQLTDLGRNTRYDLYLAALNRAGQSALSEKLPISIIHNITQATIRGVGNNAAQISWVNPNSNNIHILDRVEIHQETIHTTPSRSSIYHATSTLTAGARAREIIYGLSLEGIYQFSLTAVYRDGSRLPPVTMRYYRVDDDGDGLIDIDDLDGLNSIRCNPSGTAYHPLEGDGRTCSESGILCGMDGTSDCIGYELRRDLNFSERASYAIGVINPTWRPNTASDNSGWLTTANRGKNRGWVPIETITTTFEGNGHTIENLYTRDITGQDYQLSGLFARVDGSEARIRNVILKDALVYGGDGHHSHVGALVGELSGGTIEDVAVIGGTIYGEDGQEDRVGSLAGRNANRGTVRNSYATGNADGGEGERDYVGGLVGQNANSATVRNSYATGNADGGNGRYDYAGGLVGSNTNSTVIASHATGNADGGEGDNDYAGGLVGINDNHATIIASYATGNVGDNRGNFDVIGGLVGFNFNRSGVVASYATGNIIINSIWKYQSEQKAIGGLVGANYRFGTIVASYAAGDIYINNWIFTAGGLVGVVQDSTVAVSYATSNITTGSEHFTHASADTVIGEIIRAFTHSTIKDIYGFGAALSNHSSPLPPGASRASDLTAPVASDAPNTAVPQTWDNAAAHSKGAWNFGTSDQTPVLRYADYDGDGGAYNCDLFPAPCGTLIPGQR